MPFIYQYTQIYSCIVHDPLVLKCPKNSWKLLFCHNYSYILIGLNFLVLVLVLVLVLNMSIIKTLGTGLELFPISRLVSVLVSTEMKKQDTSWYWSQKKFHFKTCLGIGLEIKMISRQVLVLVLNRISGLAELFARALTSVYGLYSIDHTWRRPNFFESCVGTDQLTYQSLDALLPKNKNNPN